MVRDQLDELERKTDGELEEEIAKLRHDVETLGPRLRDGGDKLRFRLRQFEDKRECRRLRPVEKGWLAVKFIETFEMWILKVHF
ncbi:hypothetical protein NMG60_11030768 [Bertholletia excelsa]